jgi:hypothetical protein
MENERLGWIDWQEYLPEKEANDYRFGSSALVSKFAFLLAKQAFLMGEIPFDLGSHRLDVARPLLMGISSNANAVVKLAKENFGNEVYPIARCLIERIVTFYYLQYCNDADLKNYLEYSRQKAFRNTNRKMAVNDKIFSLKRSPEIDLSEFPELKSAVEKFTSKKSKKPITRWSGTSLEQKVAVIDAANEVNTTLLLIGFAAIYDDGSEALHGTLYGCTFHLGAYDPDRKIKSPQDMRERHKENLTMIFFLMGCLLSELNLYITKKSAVSDISKLSKATYAQIKDTMELCFKKKP